MQLQRWPNKAPKQRMAEGTQEVEEEGTKEVEEEGVEVKEKALNGEVKNPQMELPGKNKWKL